MIDVVVLDIQDFFVLQESKRKERERKFQDFVCLAIQFFSVKMSFSLMQGMIWFIVESDKGVQCCFQVYMGLI